MKENVMDCYLSKEVPGLRSWDIQIKRMCLAPSWAAKELRHLIRNSRMKANKKE